jgi:hypothetical protein
MFNNRNIAKSNFIDFMEKPNYFGIDRKGVIDYAEFF